MNSRGMSLENMYPAVIAILLVGICLGVGIFILNETQVAVSTTTQTVTNETVAAVTEAGVKLAAASYCGFHDATILMATNETSVLVPAANYTVDADTGILKFQPAEHGTEFYEQTWNVTYTYLGTTSATPGGACEAMQTTGTGVNGMASWIAVIVVVLAAAIVLSIVISSFGKNQGV